MTDEYRLDLFKQQPDGTWTQVLTERFDGPFTAEVLPMITHETGYGSLALVPAYRSAAE